MDDLGVPPDFRKHPNMENVKFWSTKIQLEAEKHSIFGLQNAMQSE
jgi:hypothetical protein